MTALRFAPTILRRRTSRGDRSRPGARPHSSHLAASRRAASPLRWRWATCSGSMRRSMTCLSTRRPRRRRTPTRKQSAPARPARSARMRSSVSRPCPTYPPTTSTASSRRSRPRETPGAPVARTARESPLRARAHSARRPRMLAQCTRNSHGGERPPPTGADLRISHMRSPTRARCLSVGVAPRTAAELWRSVPCSPMWTSS